VTDPGIRGAKQVSIDYYGAEFKLMSSMILYKQMAVASLEKVFSISPNIRIEPLETIKTRRHLTEFRQVDIEAAYATYEEMMKLGEGLLCYVIEAIREKFERELRQLGRDLKVPKTPFKKYTHRQAVGILRSMGFNLSYQEEIPWDAEEKLSAVHTQPFWITDYPITARGFYYPEHPDKPGILKDFDLLYPEGYGEAISGGEREHRYEKVVERIRRGGEDPAKYGWYLEMLKEGIPPSAGFGSELKG
jgi:asparaginyl-tRNA synthetase